MFKSALVLVMNSSTRHARWFTPSGHITGGLALEPSGPADERREQSSSPSEVEARGVQSFAQHVAGAIATVCKGHAIDTIALVAPKQDYLALAAELPRLTPPVPTLLLTDPSWADLSTAELCTRMADAGIFEQRREHDQDARDPGAISGAGAQFVRSGLTPFERQRMS